MMKVLFFALSALLCAAPGSFAATKKAPADKATASPVKTAAAPAANQIITQGGFVTKLFEAFHWGAGLPDEPKEIDIQKIIEGKRTFTYEAEDHYDVDKDGVSVKNFPLYGPFTGTGWVSGVSTPTTVHLSFLLPIDGTYRLVVKSKGDGQEWETENQKFTVNTGNTLREAVAGSVGFLEAGFHDITVTLPAEGAIDAFTLIAPPVAAVQPIKGWRSGEPLTVGDMAQAGVALLGIESTLPPDKSAPVRVAAAEVVKPQHNIEMTTKDFLGQFFSAQWVRAGFGGAHIDLPFTAGESGVYAVRLRYLGTALQGMLDNQPVAAPAKPAFDWVSLGVRRLEKGNHLLALELPPTAGVDLLELQRLQSSPADYMKLVGLAGDPGEKVTAGAADSFILLLKERFKERR